ncbi:hypothetical protein [Mycolicibacter sinensis]
MTDAQALHLGNLACTKLRMGADSETLAKSRGEADDAIGWEARRIGMYGGNGLDRGSVMNLTTIAEHELC